nr:hypothetical protein [uncultured Halomonas sp.]
MGHISLSFEEIESVEKLNRVTTALMTLDGVESAEVGRHGADVEGNVRRETLIAAVEKLGIKAY